jgi:diacylglycerol kinase (ATP)
MGSQKKRIAEARKRLVKLQARHAAMTERIERTRHKLDKRASSLRHLEAKISKAERHAYGLAHPDGEPEPTLATNLRRAYLVFNPASGPDGKQQRSPQTTLEALRAHGIEAEVGFKTSGKVGRHLTAQALAHKHDLIIAGGGDGTIEAVASQMVGTDATLGILPIGTRNNLARELGVPLDLNQACELLAAGITRNVDIGRVCLGKRSDAEYFLESSSLGLSAVVMPAGQDLRKGRFADLTALLHKLFEVKPGPIEIELDNGEKVAANSRVVTVSNAPLIGLNMLIAPEAKMDDGLLDVGVYDDMATTELAKYFIATTNGRRAHDAHVRFYRARRVVIRAAERLPVVSDAEELEDRQELEIEVLPRALKAIVGNGIALSLPVEAVPAVPPLAGPEPAAAGKDEPSAALADKRVVEAVAA